MTIKFTINIPPHPQERPRFRNLGKFTQTYDPPKSKEYKKKIANVAKMYAPGTPISSPIQITLVFYVSIPTSKSKAWKQRALLGHEFPAVRPDIDNYVKAVLDALNGIMFTDDGKIIELIAYKRYSDKPRTEVSITELIPEVQTKLF
ncbi:RusA family crossover junction endodeoxyribonuclease [Listeria monocytogenes]|uniref:RusA family crossover junction endodeoxyribonuclease n=1 Tax=Listeria monocytogenes TaxID=1639 RepID=UPI000766B2CB|nr:RusA family crossover junction endodeoxyribonuclease [Listeria monocytogenes]EAC4842329.1 RusA family crossover junction endodeoxyribonuclease [Listeria monocytogenes]EAC7343478.1 RusA family crossover junction endodeoxyribonuclease [Listeria monocytogenes]EAC9467683.1 RusA family crossover junction endodeoxyribonuclease [Listeria monocytogenes]EAD0460515.1 RusA family crossover junction endodeoxyribonuclease [Listeria monocytogenes]EAD6997191.1 RusA family crossover junction endodeoxyribon